MADRVIILESSALVRDIVRRGVELAGVAASRIVSCATVEDVLAAVTEAPAAVVLVSAAWLDAVRSQPALAPIPRIVMTALRSQPRRTALLGHDASPVLQKPWHAEQLSAVLQPYRG